MHWFQLEEVEGTIGALVAIGAVGETYVEHATAVLLEGLGP